MDAAFETGFVMGWVMSVTVDEWSGGWDGGGGLRQAGRYRYREGLDTQGSEAACLFVRVWQTRYLTEVWEKRLVASMWTMRHMCCAQRRAMSSRAPPYCIVLYAKVC
jgi:hypothetical protein